MLIAQLTNAYGPRTGGIRTHLESIRPHYAAAGVRTAVIVPGERAAWTDDEHGVIVTLPAPVFPLNRDYRLLLWRGPVLAALERLRPDGVEILDKWTLPRLAAPLLARGYRPLGFSCERLSDVLTPYLGGGPALRAAIRRYNGWFARQFSAVVCHSAYSAAELRAAGATDLHLVPLGVDLATFRPEARDEGWRSELLAGRRRLLVCVGRLVIEKSMPLLAGVMTALEAREPGVWRLAVAGAGPAATAVAGAPGVTLLGFLRDRATVARLYASADALLFPSAIESFGLTVLEALACGCPVAAAAGGATLELLRPSYAALAGQSPAALAEAVRRAVGGDRQAARRAALAYPWETCAQRLLALHEQVRGGA